MRRSNRSNAYGGRRPKRGNEHGIVAFGADDKKLVRTMKTEKVLNEFRKAGALLEGHFVLSSGLHSDVFLQKALVFQDAKRTAKLCKALAAKVHAEVKTPFSAIVS